MDSDTWATVLTILGALLELGGLVLLGWDIRDAGKASREARESYQRPEPLTWPVTKTLGVAYDISGKQPPLEQRVERLERRLRAQGSEMSQAIEELRSDMRKETYSKIQAAMAEAEERENRLRAFISETYGLGLLRRKVGVGLFVAGLALSAAGNLVAT